MWKSNLGRKTPEVKSRFCVRRQEVRPPRRNSSCGSSSIDLRMVCQYSVQIKMVLGKLWKHIGNRKEGKMSSQRVCLFGNKTRFHRCKVAKCSKCQINWWTRKKSTQPNLAKLNNYEFNIMFVSHKSKGFEKQVEAHEKHFHRQFADGTDIYADNRCGLERRNQRRGFQQPSGLAIKIWEWLGRPLQKLYWTQVRRMCQGIITSAQRKNQGIDPRS